MFNKIGELISKIKPLSGIIMNYHNIRKRGDPIERMENVQ